MGDVAEFEWRSQLIPVWQERHFYRFQLKSQYVAQDQVKLFGRKQFLPTGRFQV